MKRSHAAAFAALVLMLMCPAARAEEEGGERTRSPGFHSSLDSAMEAARQDGRPVLVVFGAEWCGACKMLRERALGTSGFREKAGPLHVVEVDVDGARKTAREFGVKAIPDLVLLADEGRILARRKGAVALEELLRWIELGREVAASGLWQGVAPGGAAEESLLKASGGRVGARVWKRAIIPSVANVVMQCFWAWSFYYIEAGFASLLTRTTLIWTAAFSLIYFADERGLVGSWRFWTGLALCLAGVVGVVTGAADFTATAKLTGIALILATAMTWAMYTVSARIAFAEIDSRVGFPVVAVYTVAGLAVAAAIFSPPQRLFGLLDLGSGAWLVVVGSGFVCISLAHILYYASMRRIGATVPALILSLTPLIVVVLSWILFRERLSGLQLISGAVLIAGCVLAVWAQEHLKRA